jgi:hypothetical protein
MAASMAVSTTIRVGNLFDFLVFLFLFSTSPAVEAPNAAAAVTAAAIALVVMVVEERRKKERRKQFGVHRFCAVHAPFRLLVLPLSMLTLFPLFLEEEEKRHPVDFVRQPARIHDDDDEEEEEAVDRNNIDTDVIVIFTVLILLLFLYPKSSALFLKRVVHSLFNKFLTQQLSFFLLFFYACGKKNVSLEKILTFHSKIQQKDEVRSSRLVL